MRKKGKETSTAYESLPVTDLNALNALNAQPMEN